MTHQEKISAALDVMRAVADAIKEAKRIPSGHLFAMLMEHGCSIEQFQTIVNTLKSTGLISEQNYELIWNLKEAQNENI